MIIAGHDIDESAAVAYVTREWGEGRSVNAQWIRDMLWAELASLPDCDRERIAQEAQKRICQWYRRRGVCKYDAGRMRWVPA